MQDGKALQAGTSHFLGQNFAKAFDVKYLDKSNKAEFVWATSWGVSTRLVGALIMAHSDDDGLVLPPAVAPVQVVIVPIYRKPEELEAISDKITSLMKGLKAIGIRVKFDSDDNKKPGWKFAEHELKGVPLRIAIGPRDLENGTAEIAFRDTKAKQTITFDELINEVPKLLDQIQEGIYMKALRFREENSHYVDSWEEFKKVLDEKSGFIYAHWDGTPETETKIKEETKATIRCIPLDAQQEEGRCIYSGKPSTQRVIFARAY